MSPGAAALGRLPGCGLLVAALLLAACSASSKPSTASVHRPAVTAPSTTEPPVTTTVTQPDPPYPVDEVTLPLVDSSRPTSRDNRVISRTRALTTVVWMPRPAGRWPLVVFAHGFDVGPAPYAALLQAWAAHGYVVAAPEFPLTDPAVAGPNLDEADMSNQPADIRFVTDWMLSPQSPLADRIDRARVALAGHSDGAESALAAAESPVVSGEPDFRAVVVMGVQPLPGNGGTNPPILVGQGDADTINPPSYGRATFEQAHSPKYYLDLRGGGHLPPLESGSSWLAGVEAVSEAFLDAYVAGERSPATVTSAAAAYPNLSVTAG